MLAGGEGSSFSGGWAPGLSTPLHTPGCQVYGTGGSGSVLLVGT